MDAEERKHFLEMVRDYQQRDDPTGWFDYVYSSANGDHKAVFWADLAANPCLIDWLEDHPLREGHNRAIAVGCGVGDDAEALADHGYAVTAFDIAPSAVDLCQKRYPESTVDYLVADLFDHPAVWSEHFDLVYECNTIQVLPDEYRLKALHAMVGLIRPGGHILVSCRSRNSGEQEDAFPLPLDHYEINGFVRCGLDEMSFLAYDDDQQPPVPHFFACYRKP